jgi:hypothetical protein
LQLRANDLGFPPENRLQWLAHDLRPEGCRGAGSPLSGGEPRASRAKNRDDRRHVLPIHELVDEGVQVRAQLNAAHLSLEPDENEGRLLIGLLSFE